MPPFGSKSRSTRPLALPDDPTASFVIPAALRGKAAKERDTFASAVLQRAEEHPTDQAASFVTRMVTPISDASIVDEVVTDMTRIAQLGFAAADEEVARGWQVPERVDECVRQSMLLWLDPRGFVKGRDSTVVAYMVFLIQAAYYYRRVGAESLNPLLAAAPRSPSGNYFRDLRASGDQTS